MPPEGAASPRLPLSEAVSNTLTVPSSRVPKAEHEAGPTLDEAELIPCAGSETEDGSEPPEAADCADMMVDLDAPLGPEPLGPEPTEATPTPEGEARGLDSEQLFLNIHIAETTIGLDWPSRAIGTNNSGRTVATPMATGKG